MTHPSPIPPDPDTGHICNPVAVVGLNAILTALLLVLALQTGLSVAAAGAVAWICGACTTIALLAACSPATVADL